MKLFVMIDDPSRRYTEDELRLANIDDEEVLEWMDGADVGERFGAVCDVERVA